MTYVAILTQALRADACCAYIRSEEVPFVVLTGDPGAFSDLELSEGTVVRSSRSGGTIVTDPSRAARAGRRRLIGWMRSGSPVGRLAERWARRARDLLPVGSVSDRPLSPDQPINEHLAAELARLHERSSISQIVVFDVFDLPTVLPFAEEHGIELLVR